VSDMPPPPPPPPPPTYTHTRARSLDGLRCGLLRDCGLPFLDFNSHDCFIHRRINLLLIVVIRYL